jgi:hypothetical protein
MGASPFRIRGEKSPNINQKHQPANSSKHSDRNGLTIEGDFSDEA